MDFPSLQGGNSQRTGDQGSPIRLEALKGQKSWLTSSSPTQVTLLVLLRDPMHSPKNFPLNPPPPPPTPPPIPTRVLTSSMPTKVHGLGGWPGRHPQGEEADKQAGKVSEHMGCICHDRQAMCQVPTCRAKRREGPYRLPKEPVSQSVCAAGKP